MAFIREQFYRDTPPINHYEELENYLSKSSCKYIRGQLVNPWRAKFLMEISYGCN